MTEEVMSPPVVCAPQHTCQVVSEIMKVAASEPSAAPAAIQESVLPAEIAAPAAELSTADITAPTSDSILAQTGAATAASVPDSVPEVNVIEATPQTTPAVQTNADSEPPLCRTSSPDGEPCSPGCP